jgi:hypothetical protein
MSSGLGGSFYGTQRGLWAGRYYKIYVDDDGLHGAWLGRQDFESAIAEAQMRGDQGQEWLLKRGMKKAQALEEEYNRMQPGSTEFLRKNKNNFSLRATEWNNLRLEPKPRRNASPNCYGVLTVEVRNGKAQTLNLVGEATLDQAAQQLSQWITVPVALAEATSDVPTLEQAHVDAAHLEKVQGWIAALVYGGMLIMSVRVCLEMRSPLGLLAMLLAPKMHFWVYMFYMAFLGKRETAARIRFNRSQKPPV